MNKRAVVGLFTLIGLAGLFGVYVVLNNLIAGSSGYRVGVHFANAAGLHNGALVFESGVNVGTIDHIVLQSDYTVDVIMAIKGNVDIPRDAKFVIQAPLTGDPTLVILPPIPPKRPKGQVGPTPAPAALALLPRQVLPIDQQPDGSNPVTINDLLEQGQGQLARVDRLLGDLEKREPAMLGALQSAITNANEITVTANGELQRLSSRVESLATTLQGSLDVASRNVVDLTTSLDSTVKGNSARVDSLMISLNGTARSLNAATDSLRELAQNREIRGNLIDTTRSIALTTKNVADLTGDLRNLTGNPQTQAQLRDTVANIDAATQKANSLLAQFGGTSSVVGVDPGATPAPSSTGPTTRSPGNGSGGKTAPSPNNLPANLRSKVGEIAKNLVSIQIRVSQLSKQAANANASPILGPDRGPQSDINVIALPRGKTSLLAGANDIGAQTTYNFAALGTIAPHVRIGGGILYSRLGVLGSVRQGLFGLEGRAYDLRRPTFDAYAKLRANPNIELFAGERDLTRTGRRSVLGVQFQF